MKLVSRPGTSQGVNLSQRPRRGSSSGLTGARDERPEPLGCEASCDAAKRRRKPVPLSALEAPAVEAVDADRSRADDRTQGAVLLEPKLEDRRADPRRPRPSDRAVAPEERAERPGLGVRDDSALRCAAHHELARRELLRHGAGGDSECCHSHHSEKPHHKGGTPEPAAGFPPSGTCSTVMCRHAPPKVRAEAMEPQDFWRVLGLFRVQGRKR
jgi:hypothetical protein